MALHKDFLGIWEQLNNPDFKPIEFDGFRKPAGLNSFSLTAKRWIETTHAILDPDIACHFDRREKSHAQRASVLRLPIDEQE